MTISDALDQLLRAALTPSAEARPPGAETESRDGPRVADIGALVAEVALKRAHELDRSSETSPDTDLARVEKLETSAGAAESLGLGFHLGAAMERIALAAREGSEGGPRLREAAWLIKRYITLLESRPLGADIHASTNRLAQAGGAIGADVEEIAAELTAQPEEAFSLAPESAALRPPAEATEAVAPEPAREPEREPERAVAPEPEPEREPERELQPAQIVHELPSVRRELFVTAVRAAIAVAAITAVVLVLTLIAQWH